MASVSCSTSRAKYLNRARGAPRETFFQFVREDSKTVLASLRKQSMILVEPNEVVWSCGASHDGCHTQPGANRDERRTLKLGEHTVAKKKKAATKKKASPKKSKKKAKKK